MPGAETGPTLVPYFGYRDAAAALALLREAFGFTETARHTGHERALGAGARVVYPPEDTEFGTRRYRTLDPEGYEWSFGSYGPTPGADAE